MARVTLLNLETVCSIARLGTFAAAAEKMRASQPAVSARVRDTEAALGVTLFERHGRRMELTTQGRELVQIVEPLLRRLAGAVGSIDTLSNTTGTLRIGCTPALALGVLPRVIGRFHERLPRMNWQVDVDLTGGMVDKLKAGKLDLAFLAGPVVAPEIRSVPLGRTRLVWVGAPALLAPGADGLAPAERLRGNLIWTLPSPSATHAQTLSMLHELGIPAEDLCTCNHTVALIAMIAAGAGVALLPEIMLAGQLARAELVALTPELPMPVIDFVIAWHGTSNRPVLHQIIDLARQCSSFERSPEAPATPTTPDQPVLTRRVGARDDEAG